MTDFNLHGLGDSSFERLIQSLALKVIGPNVAVYGDGPDGGREATFDGKVSYPSVDRGWEGYGVIQAKFLKRSRNSTSDGDWAISQLKMELDKYLEPDNKRRKPDYFIFATNVILTPVQESGSKDRVNALLENFKNQMPLRGYAVWDYDQICAFLDDCEEIRRTYAAWITPGDVLAEMIKWIQPQAPNFEETIARFLQKELLSDEFVNLEQAGHDANERIPLARVFVDLPTRDAQDSGVRELTEDDQFPYQIEVLADQHKGFIKEVLEISSEPLTARTLTVPTVPTTTEPGDLQQTRGRFVLIGGPGQGKTTVGQFICQIFRASIISRRPQEALSPEAANALSIIQTHCKDEGIEHFPVPRFPFRIVLNDFAAALSATHEQGISSVFSYLADQIRKRTDQEISANDLRQWIGQYPSVLVFDGLDEVPSSSNREQVLASIRDFWVDASSHNADILAIATSRPQGYSEDFSPAYYQHRWLVPLSKELGKHFASRLADVRYGTDSDRKEKVLNRLNRSFENESTSRLMRTPLQVTIMTALVDQMGQPPQVRWNLFKSYYDVIYRREVERDIPASDLLRHYKPDINTIHSRVGLLLQIDSEQSGRTDSKLTSKRFKTLVEDRLKEEGHDGEELIRLTEQIFRAALERLVFLVGLESDQVGFEIRSLQEFMAAECLMEGNDQEIASRLKEIAPIPNWHNVFLFASGKCFEDRQHLRGTILSICADLNEKGDDEIARAYLVGSGLALDLIEDGLSSHQPRFVQAFARIAMRALDVPNPSYHVQLSSVYEPQLKNIYVEEITRRLNDSRECIRMGAWECLVHLTDSQTPWAQELAETYWPSDFEERFRLLNQRHVVYRSEWLTRKFLELVPQMPMSRLPDLLRLGPIETQGLPQQLQPFAKVLEAFGRPYGRQISFLQTKLNLPVMQMSERESSWLHEIQNLERFHPSWMVFKAVAEFGQDPSKETLASALREIAPLLGNEINLRALRWPRLLPWPILACMEMCSEDGQLVQLANRASAGHLGDTQDWVSAENRWIERGLTLEDISSMSDDRLPFDSGVATSGFPITLSAWPMAVMSDESPWLANLLTIHSQLPKGESRSFIARMVEICLFHVSFLFAPGKQLEQGVISARTLLSIHEDIGPDSVTPLSVTIEQIAGSSQEIADFFATTAGRRNQFEVYFYRQPLNPVQVERLWRAFQEVNDNSVLLPVIGVLAERGYLADRSISVPEPDALETPDHKVAALLVLLAKEPWETDNTERFLELIQQTSLLSEGVFQRVITTVQENRPHGPFLNQFLDKLERLLPQDDYQARMHYIAFIGDCLRRRVSKFSDPNQIRQFKLPQGMFGTFLS